MEHAHHRQRDKRTPKAFVWEPLGQFACRKTINDVLLEGKKELKGVPLDQYKSGEPQLGIHEQQQPDQPCEA
jgi:hypothetical protein